MRDAPFDPTPVLNGLKDFQRRTADYVFQRLYDPADPSHRFLVADEVGLGKTLVARGVIARTIEHLEQQGTRRIDVLYICSNAEIARQNVRRLNVTGQDDFVLAERITMLPARVHTLKDRHINFVSFTPGTSFDLKRGQGNWPERAMLRLMLKRAWGAENVKGSGSERLFQGGVNDFATWRRRLKDTERSYSRNLSEELVEAFADILDRADDERSANDEPTLWETFCELCDIYRNPRSSYPRSADSQRRTFIGELRDLLARACIGALEPDLVILDEFQRFRHLLTDDTPAGELAQDLFAFQDKDTQDQVRILLLSATPYKMYTLSDEATGEDHYQDFLATVRFLLGDGDDTERFAAELREFKDALYQLNLDGGVRARAARAEVEATLRQVICRTERLAVTEDRSGMLETGSDDALELETTDLASYVALDGVARRIDAPDVMEYWKSAPYVLNFMDDYKVKKAFQSAVKDPTVAPDLARRLHGGVGLLDWDEIRRYEEIDPANARLRRLAQDTVGRGTWRLLWIPPSLPYYEPAGAYADPSVATFTKRLVFSAWAVVPKVIATLLSYDAERRIMTASIRDTAPENTPEARKSRSGLLGFSYSSERLTGMPYLALVYPSVTLAELGDPLAIRHELGGGRPSLDAVIAHVRSSIKPLVQRLARRQPSDPDVREDERWYWAVPFLLDDEQANARPFLDQSRVATAWEGTDAKRHAERLNDHIQRARQLLASGEPLGRQPDDLAEVIAWMAVAGPGNTALRALARVSDSARTDSVIRNGAARVAWGLRSLFNSPDVTELVRTEPALAYWRQLLRYSGEGNLQAVLDEFAHVLIEAHGFIDKSAAEVVPGLADAMHDAITLRTVNYGAHQITVRPRSIKVDTNTRLRSHFALRLAEEKSDDGSTTRSSEVRDAFNSPFWPFVLATTSVGQEGLDFHLYCHAVVHWNLPGNPVDLEQREGRVHRYKGHAVRKNLAKVYGDEVLGDSQNDPWETLFESGRRHRETDSDLVPYWIFTTEGGAVIERHIPTLPLSREVGQTKALQRTLAAYRLAFGQPRQEDLIAYLQERIDPEELETLADDLRIDLSPR